MHSYVKGYTRSSKHSSELEELIRNLSIWSLKNALYSFLRFLFKWQNFKSFGKDILTSMILIDNREAFTEKWPWRTLQKSCAIGFSKHTLNWFISYVFKKSFLINLEILLFNLGLYPAVPQGSILEPLLFLMYVKDMSQAAKRNFSLYADDACLVCQHRDITR